MAPWRDPEQRPALKRAWYAARRAQGLCVQCPMPSVKFARCACCRDVLREKTPVYEQARRRRHWARRLAKARARYAEGRIVRRYRSRILQWRYARRRFREKQAA